MTKVISFANLKGGCGKSTITALVANSLSQDNEKKILVLDCDLQLSLTAIRNKLIREQGRDFQFSYDLISVNIAEIKTELVKFYKSKKYDYIFVDIPGILNISATDEDHIKNFLFLCDHVFIPVKPRYLDIKSSAIYYNTLLSIKKIKQEKGYDLDIAAFVNFKDNTTICKNMGKVFDDMKIKAMESGLSDLYEYHDKSLSEKSIFKQGVKNPKLKSEFNTFIEEIEKIIS